MPVAGERRAAKDAGLVRYFSANPCPRGHVAERFTCSGSCVQCNSEKRLANLPKHRDACQRSYEKNRDAVLAWQKVYREQNGEAIKARKQRWRQNNPEKDRAYNLNRRSRLAAAGQSRSGRISGEQIAAIFARQKGKCACCGDKKKLEIDHIMPLALGGSGRASNFQGLCKPCNIRKHAKHPIDFNRSRGLLL